MGNIKTLIAQYELSQFDCLSESLSTDIRSELCKIFYSCHVKAQQAVTLAEQARQLCLMHEICASSAFSMSEDEYDIFCRMAEHMFWRNNILSESTSISDDIVYLLYAYNHNVFDIDYSDATCVKLLSTLHLWLSSSWETLDLQDAFRRLEIMYLCAPEFFDNEMLTSTNTLFVKYKKQAEGTNDIHLLYHLYNAEYARTMMRPSPLLTTIATLLDGIENEEAQSIKVRQQLIAQAQAITA